MSRVGNTMPPPEFAHVFMSQFSDGNDSHSRTRHVDIAGSLLHSKLVHKRCAS